MAFRSSHTLWIVSASVMLTFSCGEPEEGGTQEGGSGGSGDPGSGISLDDRDRNSDNEERGAGFGDLCFGDEDCDEGDRMCDSSRNVCVECVTFADCDGAPCRAGSCVAVTACESSKECNANEVCDSDLGYCVECSSDNDCADGQSCYENACLDLCESDDECGATDQVCLQESGVCVECVGADDCSDGEYCEADNTCVAQLCSPGEGLCVDDALSECLSDGNGFATSSCAAGCNEEGDACAEQACPNGDEGCSCYSNQSCNGALACFSGICVDPFSGTGGAGSGGMGSGGVFGAGGLGSGGVFGAGGDGSGGVFGAGGIGSGGDFGAGGQGSGGIGSGGLGSGGLGSGGFGSGGEGSGGTGSGGAGPIGESCSSTPRMSDWNSGSGQSTGDRVAYFCPQSSGACSGAPLDRFSIFECTSSHVPNCLSQNPESGSGVWTYIAPCSNLPQIDCSSPDVATPGNADCGDTWIFNGGLYECISSSSLSCGDVGIYCQITDPDANPWGQQAWKYLGACP